MVLIDGNKTAKEIKTEIAAEVAEIVKNGGKQPHLAAILVGHDGGSESYVAFKIKDCAEVGFKSSLYRYEDDATEAELLKKIEELNNDDDVDGFIVQLPLPKHISEQKVIEAISYKKDVDGFHPVNIGKMVLGQDTFISATPFGIMEMLRRCQIETVGKHCVVIGRSNIVGTPMSILMSRTTNPGNATVTLCHSKTQNLKEIAASADILIVAIGKPNFVTADMVKPGAVVIDVGMHRIEDASKQSGFRLTGDVDFPEVSKKASWITPVPGGVGLTTIAALLMNTMKARRKAGKQMANLSE